MAIKEQIILEGVNNTKKAFGQVNNSLTGLNGKMGGLIGSAGKFKAALGAAAAGFAAFGVINKVQDTINQFDDLAKSARTANAAVSEEAFRGFQVLGGAMAEAGIDAATFERAMLQTTSRIQAGVEGQKSYQKITDKLGDSIRDTNGNLKTGDQLLTTMINALNEGTITTEEFAKVVGGRAGPLIQSQFASLNKDAATLEATLKDVEANSNIVSLDAAQNAEVFNDTVGRLKASFGQLLTDAITPLLPKLVKLSQDILEAMPAIVEKVKGVFDDLAPAFKLVGTILTEVVFPIMSKVFEVLGSIASAVQPLVDAALPGLKKAFEVLQDVIEGIVEVFKSATEAITNTFEKAVEMKDKVTGVFSDMKDGAVESAKGLWEGVTGWFSKTEHDVVGGSIVPDMVKGVLREFGIMKEGAITLTEATYSAVTQTAEDALGEKVQAIRDSFKTEDQITKERYAQDLKDLQDYYRDRTHFDENYLKLKARLDKRYHADMARQSKARVDEQFGFIEGGLNKELDLTKLTKEEVLSLSMRTGKKALEDLAQQNKKAFEINKAMNMVSAIMNTATGVTKALAQGGIFGPFLAGAILAMGAAQLAIISQQTFQGKRMGGPVTAGSSYIVGEQGPEVVTFGRTGNVTPNNQLGGRDVNIEFTVNAIDAQSFNTALARQRDTIVAIVNEAVNDGGRRSITA